MCVCVYHATLRLKAKMFSNLFFRMQISLGNEKIPLRCYGSVLTWKVEVFHLDMLHIYLCSFQISLTHARISTPTTTILPITEGTFHGLNCFSYVIYVSQISIYQNIPKLSTHPSIYIIQSVLQTFLEKGFDFSFFVKWHMNLRGLFNIKAILIKSSSGTI